MSIVELKVPVIGESITEVTLSQWLKADGDYVALDEPICEFESDKATLEFPAEAAGKLIHVAQEDDDLEIGALVAKIDTSVSEADAGSKPAASAAQAKSAPQKESAPAPEAEKAAPQTEALPAKSTKESYASGHPSPAAGKILAEKNIPAADVTGTGRDGRITKDDAQKAEAKPAAPVAPATPAAAAPRVDFSRGESRKKMSRMRRTIAARLTQAKNETAMLTTFNEVDLTNVMALRNQVQEKFVEKFGVKLGFMSLFSKACAKALLEKPDVNAFIDGNELIYHDYVDISIAISTPTGLVVPPIKNVESLSFAEIELEIKRLANRARNGELTLEEMSGGTFAITNGGVFGSLVSTPILNAPQSAILGMHNIVSRPMAINGEVKIRPMMYLALSYDHRVIDGSTSVTFLVRVKELLENPQLLLMDI
jgi:2-oxoglutarate dehydrogenase E2 component (dihydrolipoamide succinyltransferase)